MSSKHRSDFPATNTLLPLPSPLHLASLHRGFFFFKAKQRRTAPREDPTLPSPLFPSGAAGSPPGTPQEEAGAAPANGCHVFLAEVPRVGTKPHRNSNFCIWTLKGGCQRGRLPSKWSPPAWQRGVWGRHRLGQIRLCDLQTAAGPCVTQRSQPALPPPSISSHSEIRPGANFNITLSLKYYVASKHHKANATA